MKKKKKAPAPLRFSGDVLQLLGVAMALLFCCTVYFYHGRRDGFAVIGRWLGFTADQVENWGGVYQCAAAFMLLLTPGMLLARFGLGLRLSALGFGLGDWRWGLKISLPAIVVMVPLIIFTQGEHTGLCTVYPLSPFAGESRVMFLAWAGCYLVYYVAWEGCFRGVMQLGLQERMGLIQAMLLQTAVTTLLHAANPELETFAALLAGPVLGYVAVRSRSILYVLAIHFAAGVATDLSCIWLAQ